VPDQQDASRLHPLLASRWSPTVFDASYELATEDVELLVEAARWAPAASLLVANLCHRFVEDTDWDYSEFARYDLGQAVAHMSVQARALGLHVRQFRAFNRAELSAEFALPAHWEVTSMSAIGGVPAASGGVDAAAPSRERRPVDEVLWSKP
jgi:nitroreductase